MAKNKKRTKKINTVKKTQISSREESASLIKRFFAYLIDWTLGLFVSAFPVVIIIGIKTGSTEVSDSLKMIPYPLNILAGGLAFLFAFLYYVWVPWKVWRGQTPGKRMMGIVIMTETHKPVSFKGLFLRQVVGIFLLEGFLITASTYLREIMMIITKSTILNNILYFGAVGITLISVLSLVFTWKNQAIHDLLGKTRVYPLEN